MNELCNFYDLESREGKCVVFFLLISDLLCFLLLSSSTAGGSDDADEDEGFEVTGGQAGGPGVPTSPNHPGKPKHKQTRLRRKRHKALSNKPQDFQVLSCSLCLCDQNVTTRTLDAENIGQFIS